MNKNKVMFDYDYKGDSLFIYSIEPYDYEVSLELNNDVILDFDTKNQPVAFEFLNASKIFNLDKNYFKNLVKISIQSKITEECIRLKVQLYALIHNKNQIFDVNRITTNLNHIPNFETELISV